MDNAPALYPYLIAQVEFLTSWWTFSQHIHWWVINCLLSKICDYTWTLSQGPVCLPTLTFLYLRWFAFVMTTSNIDILRLVKFFKRKVSLWHPFKFIVSQGMYFEKGQMVAFPRTSVTHHSFTEQPRCCWQLVCKSCWQFVQCLSCWDWGCPGHTIYQI